MEDVSLHQSYPLPDPKRSAALDAIRLRTALQLIDLNIAEALAEATVSKSGRIKISRYEDILEGKSDSVPVASDVKKFVDNIIANLMETSEETLEALEKLRKAIGDDPESTITILERLNQKADLSLVKDRTVPVGAEMDFTGTVAPPGWLIENGVLLPRSDIPELTAFALQSGNIVTEEEWSNNRFGSYSYGPGGINGDYLRIPDTRGLFTRACDLGAGRDPGRLIGSYQSSQNLAHKHTITISTVADHIHSVWTDSAGWHQHWIIGRREAGLTGLPIGGNYQGLPMIWDGGYACDGNGTHNHAAGMGAAGKHNHTGTIDNDGGSEARPNNIARLKILKY